MTDRPRGASAEPSLVAQACAEQALKNAERVLADEGADSNEVRDCLREVVGAMPGVLAICQTWEEMSNALDRCGAATACQRGYDLQDRLRRTTGATG